MSLIKNEMNMKKLSAFVFLLLSLGMFAQKEETFLWVKERTTVEQFEIFKKACALYGDDFGRQEVFMKSLTRGDTDTLFCFVEELIKEKKKSNSLTESVPVLSLSMYEKVPTGMKRSGDTVEFRTVVYSDIEGYDAHIEARVRIDLSSKKVLSCEYTTKSDRGIKITLLSAPELAPSEVTSDGSFFAYFDGVIQFITPSGKRVFRNVKEHWFVPSPDEKMYCIDNV